MGIFAYYARAAGQEIKKKVRWTPSASASPQASVNKSCCCYCVFFPFYKVCHKCHAVFQDNDTKHHCRACGEGFCDRCSSKAAPVPERGWGLAPVRVCDGCFEQRAAYAGMRPALRHVNWVLFVSVVF